MTLKIPLLLSKIKKNLKKKFCKVSVARQQRGQRADSNIA